MPTVHFMGILPTLLLATMIIATLWVSTTLTRRRRAAFIAKLPSREALWYRLPFVQDIFAWNDKFSTFFTCLVAGPTILFAVLGWELSGFSFVLYLLGLCIFAVPFLRKRVSEIWVCPFCGEPLPKEALPRPRNPVFLDFCPSCGRSFYAENPDTPL